FRVNCERCQFRQRTPGNLGSAVRAYDVYDSPEIRNPTSCYSAAALALEFLFLLPGGRPRFLGGSANQAGGLPRRRPRPRASRSRLKIASSSCIRSWRSSARILVTSMVALLYLCFDPDVFRKQNRTSRIRTSLE